MTRKTIKPGKDDEDSLTKRYLFWLYKTTKDELDKIDRKFTQLQVDRHIQKTFEREIRKFAAPAQKEILPFLDEFREYVFQKQSDAQRLKFAPSQTGRRRRPTAAKGGLSLTGFTDGGRLNARYLFLHLKLNAVMRMTKLKFGRRVLDRFKQLYEGAAMKSILEDASGRR